MRGRLCALASACMVVAATTVAGADPCDVTLLDPGSPIRIGMGPGGLGRLPEACARTELGVDTRGAALIDMDDFYGSLEAGVRMQGRIPFSRQIWLSFATPGLDLRYNANATIDKFATDSGAGSIGVHYRIPIAPRISVAPFARTMTPTESVYRNATRYGFDHGVSAVARVSLRNEVVGGFVFPLYLVAGPGSTHSSLQPLVGADWIYSPWSWLGLAAGAAVRFRGGDDAAFESFDPRAGLRFHPWRGMKIELTGAAPLFGADRTDVVLGLGFAWIVPPGPS